MGEIFSAHDEKLNRTVAVKFIAVARLDSGSSRRLFLHEARAAAALDHPFICTVHDVLEHQGQPVIVMERVEGETLQDLIARGPLPPESIVGYAREIAEALASAHQRGIVHRDIKSANIMLTPSGHVKVMDFGLALIVHASPEEATAHRSEELASRFAGTLPYMSPEVLRGESATRGSDVYALGVVMYEMATGRRPFTGKTDAILISQILEQPPTFPADVPAALKDLILKLLAKDPKRRPEISDVIKALSDGKPKTRRSLAVLPFQSLTSDDDNAHLGLALADATTSELALLHSLIVRPTAAILRYQATVDPIVAARELGVDTVVTGTFQRAGSRLRVTVQLISAAEERPLWSTKIDTTFNDMFAMQDEVSRKIVDALKVEMTPAEEQRLARRIHTPGDVVELCFKGRVALLDESVAQVNEAIEFFERARDLDPKNPLPWIGLSDAYSRLAFTFDPDGGWDERARAMSDHALQLDPDIPEGHYIRARLAWTPKAGFQHEYAMREMAIALSQRPNLNEGFDRLGTICFHVGLIDEAEQLYWRATTINPSDPFAERMLGTVEALRGNYEESVDIELRSASKSYESWGLYTLAFSLIRQRDLDAAEKSIDHSARLTPYVLLYEGLRAEIAALRGDRAEAEKAIERTSKNRKAFGHFHHVEFNVACTLAMLGRKVEALDWLRASIRNGFPCLAAVENDPFLVPLHQEAEYQAVIEGLRVTRDRHRAIFRELSLDVSR